MKVLFELDMTPEEMEKMMPSFRAFCRERNLDEVSTTSKPHRLISNL